MHVAAPSVSEYDPGLQLLHVLDASGLAFPTEQIEQFVEAGTAANCPAGQAVQLNQVMIMLIARTCATNERQVTYDFE